MKRSQKLILLLLLLVSSGVIGFYLWYNSRPPQTQEIPVKPEITQLPTKLPFLALKSFTYPPQNQKSIIFYFHPECDHCGFEADDIHKQLEDFRDTQLIWISPVDTTTIRQFVQDHQLDQVPNIHWMSDTANVFPKMFNPDLLPSSWVFDQNGKLLKHFNGQTKPEALLKFL